MCGGNGPFRKKDQFDHVTPDFCRSAAILARDWLPPVYRRLP